MKGTAERSRLGAALRALRRQKGWTLADVSRRTGFSVPTLSKVENGKLSLSYDKLIRVSEGLEVDIAQLFSPVNGAAAPATITGRRSINKVGEGDLVGTRNYDYLYLSGDVTRKKFVPILTEVHAMFFRPNTMRTFSEKGDWSKWCRMMEDAVGMRSLRVHALQRLTGIACKD